MQKTREHLFKKAAQHETSAATCKQRAEECRSEAAENERQARHHVALATELNAAAALLPDVDSNPAILHPALTSY